MHLPRFFNGAGFFSFNNIYIGFVGNSVGFTQEFSMNK